MSGASATLEQAGEALARGEQNAEALLGACLDRIAAQDGRWHAMLAINPEAGSHSRSADACAAAGQALGPLHGVPIVVKDNIDVAGMATTSGCRALATAMPNQDAEVVRHLRAAGAIILGKTNLSELSFEIRSRSSLGGDVLCPRAPWATAGGSSGGSAVAVASGFALAALGTDTGGSIRVPAACNGVVGFRPAHGALSLAGIAPLAPSTDTVGLLTSSVADARLLYQVLGGALAKLPVPLRKLRLGVLRQAFGDQAEVIAASERALEVVRHAGAFLADVKVAGLESLLAGPHIVDAEFAGAFDRYLATNFVAGTAPDSLAALVASGEFLSEYESTLRRRLDASPVAAAAILLRHEALKQALSAVMDAQSLDGLIYPTMRVIPESLDNPKGGWAAELAARTGWPAISVPAPVPVDARPVGIEVLMPGGQEETLFAVAAAIGRAGRASG